MDWMPRPRNDKYVWWKNLSEHIEDEGPKFGLTPAEIAAIKALADQQIADIEAIDAAQSALDGARAGYATSSELAEAEIRNAVRYWRTRSGFAASGSEGVLQLIGPESDFDPNTFKPVLKVTVVGGIIKVEFTKKECDSMAIYCRLRGTQGWTKLAIDTRSPYMDTVPLADPAVPEMREYMARGVIDNIEIGQPSDIVTVTYAG